MGERLWSKVERRVKLVTAAALLVAVAYLGWESFATASSDELERRDTVSGMAFPIWGETKGMGRERKLAVVARFDEFGNFVGNEQLNTFGRPEIAQTFERLKGQVVQVDMIDKKPTRVRLALARSTTRISTELPTQIKIAYVHCSFLDSPAPDPFPIEHGLDREYWNRQFGPVDRVQPGETYPAVRLDKPWLNYLDANGYTKLAAMAQECLDKVQNLDPRVSNIVWLLDKRAAGTAYGGRLPAKYKGVDKVYGFAWLPTHEWVKLVVAHELGHGFWLGHSASHEQGKTYDSLMSEMGDPFLEQDRAPHPTRGAYPRNLSGPNKLVLGSANRYDVPYGKIVARALGEHDVLVATRQDGSEVTVVHRDNLLRGNERFLWSGFGIETVDSGRVNRDWVWTEGVRAGIDPNNLYRPGARVTLPGEVTVCALPGKKAVVANGIWGFSCPGVWMPMVAR